MALLRSLVNDGDFKHNTDALRKGTGEVVVGRRSSLIGRRISDFVACAFCKRFYSKKNLWRHTKDCPEKKEYYRAHGEVSVDGNRKRIQAVKNGRTLVYNAIFDGDDNVLNEMAAHLRDDEITPIVVSDKLIRREAALRITALGRKEDQKQDDVYRVNNSARTLGRILSFARVTKPGISLNRLLRPCNFDFVVDIARKMSIEKERPSLNVGKTIGFLLKKVCQSKYCLALRKGDENGRNDATNFTKLIEAEWNSRVNRPAVRQMEREKRMTVPAIPITEDLQKFRDFLLRNMKHLNERLRRHPNPEDWLQLAKLTMCRLILFNKRRRGEVRELRVSEYLARPNWQNDDNGEMALALSPMDRLLAKR